MIVLSFVREADNPEIVIFFALGNKLFVSVFSAVIKVFPCVAFVVISSVNAYLPITSVTIVSALSKSTNTPKSELFLLARTGLTRYSESVGKPN